MLTDMGMDDDGILSLLAHILVCTSLQCKKIFSCGNKIDYKTKTQG